MTYRDQNAALTLSFRLTRETWVKKAIEDMMRMVDGNRVVRVSAGEFFTGGIETEEQLEAALNGLREKCAELIGEGKKILIQ